MSKTTDPDLETLLPPKPDEPAPSECCGSGCDPCVLDLYTEELNEWRRRCAEIRARYEAEHKKGV